MFIRLVRWGLQSLDIYTLQASVPTPLPRPPSAMIRSKEEKEVLEHFSGVVSHLYSTLTLIKLIKFSP